jgi:hypothetical protein
MINLQRIQIEACIEEFLIGFERNYGLWDPEYGNIGAWAAQMALENIANADTLYHNLDHAIMATMAGQQILRGKHLIEGNVTPLDWLHFTVAVLCHDIGYVKGICKGDRNGVAATGVGDATVELPAGCTGASLTPHHVARSQLFIRERFTGNEHIDAEQVATLIEMTRFPVPEDARYQDTSGYGGLVRGADFIGQFGDPNYLRRIPALFYEFEEIGANARFGYASPGDIRARYARFFWGSVSGYLGPTLHYLEVTQEGKQWIASLYANIFTVEHGELAEPAR